MSLSNPLVVSLSNHEPDCSSFDRLRTSECTKPSVHDRYRLKSAALNNTLNVPNGWPRHSGLNPRSTT